MSQFSNFPSLKCDRFAVTNNHTIKKMTMKKLISWVEIPVADMDRAVRFYNKILDLSLEILDFGEEKMACFPNDEGALSQSPGFKSSKNGVLVSFNAGDDLDKTLDRIVDASGSIIIPRTKIEAEGRGYFATFQDCEGNTIGLYGDN